MKGLRLLVAAIATVIVGCGVGTQMDESTLQEWESALCNCDPIMGTWRSNNGVYAATFETSGIARWTKSDPCPGNLGKLAYDKVVQQSCDASTCTYSATRYGLYDSSCTLYPYSVRIVLNKSNNTFTEYFSSGSSIGWYR